MASFNVPYLTRTRFARNCSVTRSNRLQSRSRATSSRRNRSNAVRSGVASLRENPQNRRNEARSRGSVDAETEVGYAQDQRSSPAPRRAWRQSAPDRGGVPAAPDDGPGLSSAAAGCRAGLADPGRPVARRDRRSDLRRRHPRPVGPQCSPAGTHRRVHAQARRCKGIRGDGVSTLAQVVHSTARPARCASWARAAPLAVDPPGRARAIPLAATTATRLSCNEKIDAPTTHDPREGSANAPNRVGAFSRNARANSPKCAEHFGDVDAHSSFWKFSMIATIVRPHANAMGSLVCTNSNVPSWRRTRVFSGRAW